MSFGIKIRMKPLLFIVSLLIINVAHGQTDDIKAKAYYVKAREAYGNGYSRQALDYLDETLLYLGRKSNAKVEALYVHIYRDLKEPLKTETHLNLYFKHASESNSEYVAMLKLVVEVEEDADAERYRIQREKEAEEERQEKERLRKIEMEKERLQLEKEEELRKIKEAEELKIKEAQELKEKKQFNSDLELLNKYIAEGDLEQAEKLNSRLKSSTLYSESNIENYSELRCYMNYKSATNVNTPDSYYDFLKNNTNCSGINEAKTKLEKLSIEKGDVFYNSESINMKNKSIPYYKMYLEYFPEGDKSGHASSRLNSLRLQKEAKEKKEARIKKHKGYELAFIMLTISRHSFGFKVEQVYNNRLGLSFNIKAGSIFNERYQGLSVSSDNNLFTRAESSLVPNTSFLSNRSFYDLSESYFEAGNQNYELNRYHSMKKKKTQSVTIGVGTNYRIAYPLWAYANVDIGYVSTRHLYTKTQVEGKDIGSIDEVYIVNTEKSGFRIVPELGILLPFKKLHLSLGTIKYPSQPLAIIGGIGFTFK